MARLTKTHKAFIVRSLARYSSLNEVMSAFQDKFDQSVSKQQVALYDPGNKSSTVGKELQELFYSERDKYLNVYNDLPLTRRGARLRELSEAAGIAREKAKQNGTNDDIRTWADCIMKIHRIMQDIEGGNKEKQAAEAEDVKRFYQQINQNIYFNK